MGVDLGADIHTQIGFLFAVAMHPDPIHFFYFDIRKNDPGIVPGRPEIFYKIVGLRMMQFYFRGQPDDQGGMLEPAIKGDGIIFRDHITVLDSPAYDQQACRGYIAEKMSV
jgi:hypothetical protein